MLKRREFLKLNTNSSLRPVASAAYWLHVSRTAMACRFEVTLSQNEKSAIEAAQQALDEADRLEEQLTIFRESSEISFINRQAAAEPVRIEESLFALLRQSQRLWRETEGAFDITSGPLSQCWGFLRRQGRIPSPEQIETARARVGSDKLIFDDEARTILLERTGVEINLGSIGKGHALDRIAEMTRGRVRTALLSAGSSSMRAIGSGAAGQNGWVVGIRHPHDRNKRLAVVRLRDAALSTSGSEEQFFEFNGKRYGHIIDPRSGWPAENIASVTVIASSAAIADALATAFYVGGRELAEKYCAAYPDILALMLESGAQQPLLIGNHHNCEVEIINE